MYRHIAAHQAGSAFMRPLLLLALWVFATTAVPAYAGSAPPAPVAAFTTATGKTLSTTDLKGRPTMLWLLSTWCGSCAAGLQTLAQHADILRKTGLRVVVLRNYKNDGYPGLHIAEFTRKVLPNFNPPKNWVLGQASRQLGERYNAKFYPDIYFLMDAKGRIRSVDSAPSATFARILAFARNPANR